MDRKIETVHVRAAQCRGASRQRLTDGPPIADGAGIDDGRSSLVVEIQPVMVADAGDLIKISHPIDIALKGVRHGLG
ncbi:hypothetical protein D3C81_1621000 [compost metagenome]